MGELAANDYEAQRIKLDMKSEEAKRQNHLSTAELTTAASTPYLTSLPSHPLMKHI